MTIKGFENLYIRKSSWEFENWFDKNALNEVNIGSG